MAQIPDFTAVAKANPQPGGGIASYQPPNWRQVGYGGQVLQDAGRTMESASEMLAQTNERQDALVAQDAANKLRSQSVAIQYDPSNGFANVKEGNAVGAKFITDYTQRYNDAQSAIRDGLQTPNQQRIFDQHAQINALQFKQQLLEHQARQTDAFNDSTDNATLSLTLNDIARQPTNDLNFQTGLAKINGTIDSMGKRKGLPSDAVSALKQHYFDAATSSRLLSVMDGIPGVVQSNPYLAEKMFDEVQGQLGAQAQVQLGHQILQATKAVQMRDGARAELAGTAIDPKSMLPSIQGIPPLQGIVRSLESNGNPNAVSPKGAQGSMQVMPATQLSPGFGVRPAQLGADGKPLPGEIDRVGSDYLGAMTARYQSPALTLAAYNAGPAQVDKWIAKFGDPRLGGISESAWAQKIPFDETRNYVTSGLQRVTANSMKAEDLPAILDRARDHAEAMYPNDPAFVDGYVARAAGYANQVIQQKQAQQQASADVLTQSLVGNNAPKTIDAALSDPQIKQAFNNASPQAQLAYQERLSKGDSALTPEAMNKYYGILNVAGNDPEQFGKMNLADYQGQIPDHLLLQLMNTQKSVNQKDLSQQAKDLNWKQAVANVDDMLKPLGWGRSAKPNTAQSKNTEQFYGRLNEALQNFHDTNQKWPGTQDTRKIAAGLLTPGAISGGMFWDTKEPYFQALSEGNAGKFYVPLPANKTPERAALNEQFKNVYGRVPNDAELQAAYTRYKLMGGK